MSPEAWTTDTTDIREHIPDEDLGPWALLPSREALPTGHDVERNPIGQAAHLLRWKHPTESVCVTVAEQTQYMDPQVWYWGKVTVYNPGFTVGINKKDGDLATVLDWAVAWMQAHPDPGFLVDDPQYANRYTSGECDPGHDYA